MAKQTITRTTRTTKRGIAAIPNANSGGGSKRGRPVGAKDTKPRKTRSDKGKKRGKYRKRTGTVKA